MALIEKVAQPLALYLFLFLISGIFFYGLSLWHRVYKSIFAKLFQWWTAFYLLVFAFVLTFQSFIPMVWANEINLSATSIIFLSCFGLLALVVSVSGIFKALNRKTVSGKEILAVIIIVVVLIGLIGLTKIVSIVAGTCYTKSCYNFKDRDSCNSISQKLNCVWENNYCKMKSSNYYTRVELCDNFMKKECISHPECGWRSVSVYSYFWAINSMKEVPFILWAVWIIINIFFILLTLTVIGYGTLEKSSEIINLGIIFFSLDIITRYIGFMMDFWGYTSLAIIFITGGVLLVFGGWLITRWRKKLIAKAKGEQNFQANIKKKQNEKKLS